VIVSKEPTAPRSEKLSRPGVPALDEILGQPFKVLDDGLIRVVDYMGDDSAVVQAARVSYGAGTKKVSDDRGLIRYLLQHRHTTPFEMCSLKLHVRVPMDAWRQWIRHRTACLAEGTELYFDLPGGIAKRGNQLYKLKIEDIWEKFQPTSNTQRPDKQRDPYFKRDRIKAMSLRHLNHESGKIEHTRVVDVYKNGPKPVFRFKLADGKSIEATADHQFFFTEGWSTFGERVALEERGGIAFWNKQDIFLHVNGDPVQVPALYQDSDSFQPRLVQVVEIEYVGIKETYDVEVVGPHHNFIANGIVTHNSVNEYSTRYSVAINASQKTAPDEWRTQAVDNKQGSGEALDPRVGSQLTASEQELHTLARHVYQTRIDTGVAREQARKDLPLCTYTEAYWKVDLHNLLHFLALRMDSHAQKEIRDYATIIGEQIVSRWVPLTWEAFQDFRFQGMVFSRIETEIMAAIGQGDLAQAKARAKEAGWLRPSKKGGLIRSRERMEFEEKLRQLNLGVPWEKEASQ
jgi:thymidylate synthase ThyX